MVNINNLPREILLHIFSYYLSTETQCSLIRYIAPVCQYWKEICMDSSLWHIFDGTLTLNDLKKYCKRGCLKNTESLVFSYRKSTPSSSELQLIYENLPRLKFINFSKVTEQVGKEEWKFISELINHCPDLREIIFLEIHLLDPPRLPFRLIQNFLKIRGTNLVSLDFSNLTISSFRDLFITVASSCPNLESLKAQNISGGNYYFPIQYMQDGLKKLEVLRLGYPVVLQNCSSMPVIGFPNLDTFTHASKFDYYTQDSHLEKLLMKSSNLKVLDIRGCILLTCTVLCSLPANNLERLYVSDTKLYEFKGFENVLKKWARSLVVLDVSKMKGDFINCLFKSDLVDSLQNLESLDLNNTVVTMFTVGLIIQSCPKLNFLQLESCRSLGRGRKRAYHGQAEIKKLLHLENVMEVNCDILMQDFEFSHN